jgi:hypothetical protein
MKIFYTASFGGKAKYQENYNKIQTILDSLGMNIVSTEKGNYTEELSSKFKTRTKDRHRIHYEAIKTGILTSDAVVIEASHEDFQLGYEAAFAMQSKKHLLCLSVNEDFSEKIKNEYIHGAQYNMFNVKNIIEEFIDLVKKERLSRRLNLFISDRQYEYLKKQADTNNLNVSEYIRKLVEDDMKYWSNS